MIADIMNGLDNEAVRECAKKGVQRILVAQPVDPNSWQDQHHRDEPPLISKGFIARAWGVGITKEDIKKF